jgi:16S rRNA (guanine966-N2)-methyltransferase
MSGIRITGGKFKGHTIGAPKGGPARLTSGRVREAIFDLLGNVEGLVFLDLFAGAGSFTAEALSHGAASVTAVEVERRAVTLISRNLKILGVLDDCLLLNMDVRYAVPMLYKQGKSFDIIFADPPYEMGHVASVGELLKKNPLVNSKGLIIFEHSKREDSGIAIDDFAEVRVKKYGDTVLTIAVNK